jgi:hypothetical protein
MKNRKYLAYLFLAVGLLNVISLLDTILSDPNISFTIFSIPTSKTINIVFYAILSLILIYAGIGEYKKILNQNNK